MGRIEGQLLEEWRGPMYADIGKMKWSERENMMSEEQEQLAVGEIVHRERSAHGYSIHQLARLAKVSDRWLSRLEQGVYATPDPRGLHRLAGVLEIETEALFVAADYSEGLPNFEPYLRSTTDLPDEAIDQLKAHFDLIIEKYDRDKGGSDVNNHSTAA
jgi:transcriptional regulator with XRE-family HTH domain